jgi:hypothetical protein
MKASKLKNKSKRTSKQEKHAYWKNHIAMQKTSNLSRRAYCKINNLIYYNFCYWHRKLEDSSSNSSSLIPIKIKSENDVAGVLGSVKLSNGYILHIHSMEAMNALIGGLSR